MNSSMISCLHFVRLKPNLLSSSCLSLAVSRPKSKKTYTNVNPVVLKDRLLKKAISVNVGRRAVAFSEENSDALDVMCKTLSEKYPYRNKTHVHDIFPLNGLLTKRLLRDSWPRVTTSECISIGNVLNLEDIRVPSGVDHQIVIDQVIHPQPDVTKLLESVYKGCDRENPCIPSHIIDLYQPKSQFYETMTSSSNHSCESVAVGCFGDSKSYLLKLNDFAFNELNRLESSVLKRSVDLLVFVPPKVESLLNSKNLGSRKFKFLLEWLTVAEKIDELPTDCFEFYYKPTEMLPEVMSLFHLKPRKHVMSETFNGIKPELFNHLRCFHEQWSYSPSRRLETCLDFWAIGSCKQILTAEERKLRLKNITLNQLAELYLKLVETQDFDLLINSWLSQKFEGAENVNNSATELFKEDSYLKTTGTELKNNLIEQLKVKSAFIL